MIIFNETVNIENDVREEWLNWMRTVHIPDVMATGYFIENMICKVLVNEEQGTTYSIQYVAANIQDVEEYKQKHASRLQKEVNDKFAGKTVSFRTLLEIL